MIDLLELTQKLISIPSPTGQEREICDFIEGWIPNSRSESATVGSTAAALPI